MQTELLQPAPFRYPDTRAVEEALPAYGAAERDAPLELLGDVLRHELRFELGATDLFDVGAHAAPRERFQLGAHPAEGVEGALELRRVIRLSVGWLRHF